VACALVPGETGAEAIHPLSYYNTGHDQQPLLEMTMMTKKLSISESLPSSQSTLEEYSYSSLLNLL
jgi:hypothetical protein